MTTASRLSTPGWLVLALILSLGTSVGQAQLDMGTSFTYQGELIDAGVPANGPYDFTFELHDNLTTGTQVGSTITVDDLLVMDGVFDVPLDFGSGIFEGSQRWLQISVRDGASVAAHTPLAPRQELTPVPYAIFAVNASDSEMVGGMTAGQLQDDRPPVAILESSASDVFLGSLISDGHLVDFSLSQSYDPEGGALTYGFDLTGQEAGQPTYGGSAVDSFTFEFPGTYNAEGWVRDAAGQFNLDKVTINVQEGAFQVAPDKPGDVGQHTSLAEVNGNPAIAYYDDTNRDLKYVRASDPLGKMWDAPISVDTAGNVGEFTSLAVVNGNPAISYYAFTPSAGVRYVRATDASGATWGTPIVLDATGTEYNSLAVVNGNPAVAYWSSSSGLKYVRATDASGTTWGAPIVIAGGNVGRHASLAVVNGNPAIAYIDTPNSFLRYVRATTANGAVPAEWGTPLPIDGFSTFANTSLAVVNGNPAVSYYDVTFTNLKYIRATNASGTAWGGGFAIDSTGDVGAFTSLEVVNGNPAISYYDATNRDLKYVRATTANGSVIAEWGDRIAIDSDGDVGSYSSLGLVNGIPMISHYDATNGNLKFTR